MMRAWHDRRRPSSTPTSGSSRPSPTRPAWRSSASSRVRRRSAPATSRAAATSASRRSRTTSRSSARPASSTSERRGTWIYYRLAPAAAERLRSLALGAGLARRSSFPCRRCGAPARRRDRDVGPRPEAPRLSARLRPAEQIGRDEPAQRARPGGERPVRVDPRERALPHREARRADQRRRRAR